MSNKQVQYTILLVGAVGVVVAFWNYHTTGIKTALDIQASFNELRHEDSEKSKEYEKVYEDKIILARNSTNDFNFKNLKDSLNIVVQNASAYLQEFNQLSNENSGLKQELTYKSDSIRQLIHYNSKLIVEINQRDSIIAERDSEIEFYKNEIVKIRKNSQETLDLFQKAVTLETEADKTIGFWNKKDKRVKYAKAAYIYERIWRKYEILSAEKCFHRTSEKLQLLGVELSDYLDSEK